MRVADWRMQRIQSMPNVSLYLNSHLSADDVLGYGFHRVFLATGAQWRRDGLGRQHRAPLIDPTDAALQSKVFTPDDVFAGAVISSPVLIYDDDHYYMGGAMAELLRKRGLDVHLVTPSTKVSEFTEMTMEQHRIQSGLLKIGVQVHTGTEIADIYAVGTELVVGMRGLYADTITPHPCASVLMVTMRDPLANVFTKLQERRAEWQPAGIRSVQLLGDAYGPGTVAAAVYAGHRAARELDAPALALDEVPFKRELISLAH